MLGVAYWLSAEPERSIEQLEQAVRRDATNERARLMLARVLDEIDDTARAEQALEQTVAAIPSSAMAHLRLGRLYVAASRTEDAVREYEAAAGIGALAGEAPLMVDIGELHRRELDATKAEAAFARAVALRPNDAVAHRERGRALLQMERPDAALVELAAALLIDADDYLSYLTIGQIHLDAGRHAQAETLVTRAIAIDAEKPEAYYALASALARSGRGDEAKAHLATFARLQEKSLDDQRRRIELSTSRLQAGVLIEKGAFEDAAEAWTKILADWGDVAAHHAGLARALAGLGQVETAVAHYEQSLALNADATVYRELAAFYDRLGRAADAVGTRARLAQARQAAFAGATVPDRR
jgi:tetratricopeptide (TPR) repeat protein